MRAIAAIIPIILLLDISEAVHTTLAGGEEDCIIVRTAPKAEVILHYEALPDENSKVRVSIAKQTTSPGQVEQKPPKRIKATPAARSGSMNLTADVHPKEETHFTICFANAARHNNLELMFSVRADAYEHLHDVATQRHAEGLLTAIMNLSQDTKNLLQQQEFTLAREQSHRTVMVSTNGRIWKWSFVQATSLVVIALAQIMYIRRLFQSTKTIL